MWIFLVLLAGISYGQELTLSIGTHRGPDFGSGRALGVSAAQKVWQKDRLALSGQFDFLASPNRKASVANPLGSRDVASLFAVPGLKLDVARGARVAPFLAGGVGWAVYEQSELLQNGQRFPGSRSNTEAVWLYGGGVDVKLHRFVALRFEVKDYFASRHNVVFATGLNLRWGGK